MNIHEFLVEQLLDIKKEYEMAVRIGGDEEKIRRIRSSILINHLHEFVKQDFINHGVDPSKIYPRRTQTRPELKMSGFLKTKAQDITIIPSDPSPEIIETNSILIGSTDRVGKDLTDRAITVNIRSQLSSLNKNFDTLFERTFAESLNLHLRSNRLIMGELYLVPLREYDQATTKQNQVKFGNLLHEKFLIGFNALNNRLTAKNSSYKYERVVLLIVDFEHGDPKIIDKNELMHHGILKKKHAENIDGSLFDPFSLVPDLLREYKKRHESIDSLRR